MNRRLFHLQGVGCKILNYRQVARKGKNTNKAKSMDIDKFLCIKVYTKVKSFGPAHMRPPLREPLLISAPAELAF